MAARFVCGVQNGPANVCSFALFGQNEFSPGRRQTTRLAPLSSRAAALQGGRRLPGWPSARVQPIQMKRNFGSNHLQAMRGFQQPGTGRLIVRFTGRLAVKAATPERNGDHQKMKWKPNETKAIETMISNCILCALNCPYHFVSLQLQPGNDDDDDGLSTFQLASRLTLMTLMAAGRAMFDRGGHPNSPIECSSIITLPVGQSASNSNSNNNDNYLFELLNIQTYIQALQRPKRMKMINL